MPITPTAKIWMNGDLVDWDQARIHVLTHTLHYGTGVFEGIRAYETDDGPAVFRLTDHIVRLLNSGKIIGMEIPYTVDELVQATKARWGSTRSRAPSTSRSRAGRGVRTSATTPSRRACA
jgi:branched-chain amino acid aminotransferase